MMIGNLNKRLESPTCFSKSELWEHIKQFYTHEGHNAWDQKIPYLVTNSIPTAYYHANLIIQHAKGPYNIIDFGAGIGQHGYYLAKALSELAKASGKPIEWFSIYLAEISPNVQEFWKKHPNLKPYIEMGLIKPLSLLGDWNQDSKNLPKGPQHCIIANYLFDSMPFMAYEDGYLAGLSLYCKRKYLPNPSLQDLILKPQKLSELAPKHYLDRYSHLRRFTIPKQAIAFIQNIFSTTHDSILITNDKMFLTPSDIDYDSLFNLTYEGCYSTTLNMDAIIQELPHLHYQSTNHCQRLQTVTISHHPIPKSSMINCSDVASLFEFYKQQTAIPSKLSFSIAASFNNDPFCLEILSQSIIPDTTPCEKIQSLITTCLQNQFHKPHDFSLLHAAKIMRRCHFYDSSNLYLEDYLKQHGEHPAYHLEKGILLYQWKKTNQAINHLRKAQNDQKTIQSATALLQEIL